MTRSLSLVAITLLALLFIPAMVSPAPAQDRAKIEKKIESLLNKLKAKEQEFLAPAAEDRAAYADFLRQPDTGLTRLLPREKYDGKLLTRGGGAYYSFTRLTHEYGYGSDIELQRDEFSVGFAGADFGFLTSLGNTALEAVTLDHPGVRYLAEFTPPSVEPEAREQQRRSSSGFEVNGFTYKSRIPFATDTTYVLRSINYRDSDVLVALRVVRQDADGSVVFLWKILKKFPAPPLQ